MIRALARSDDFTHVAGFDAEPWFEQASEREIVDLSRIEWGGDAAADVIADHLGDRPGYGGLAAMFAYVLGHPNALTNDAVGFEVHVDRGDALRWLMANRREVFDEVAVVEGIDAAEEEAVRSAAQGTPIWEAAAWWKGDGYESAASAPAP